MSIIIKQAVFHGGLSKIVLHQKIMSSFVFMKILESAPDRYDLGIRLLTLGKLDQAYDRLAENIHKGQRVLDIGCGTGALTLKSAAKGAKVSAIDVNAAMLEVARKKVQTAGYSDSVEFFEIGVAELGQFADSGFDVVTSGLCFSELSPEEIGYSLKEIYRLLKKGGRLMLADEVKPASFFKKILHFFTRAPLVLLTYILTQTTTTAISGLDKKVEEAGFAIEFCRLNKTGSFMEIVARRK